MASPKQVEEVPEGIKGQAAAIKEARQKRRLQAHRFAINQGTQFHNVFRAVPEDGTILDDMLDADYWQHVAQLMRPWDRVQVEAENGSFYAELIVQTADRLTANVRPIAYADLSVGAPSDGDIPTGFRVEWAGPISKWRVLDSRSNVVKEGYQNKSVAIQWISNHAKSLRL